MRSGMAWSVGATPSAADLPPCNDTREGEERRITGGIKVRCERTSTSTYAWWDEANRFNLSAFGAKGDGSTDDSVAINAWKDAITAAGGGVAYVPPGRYLYTSGTAPIVFPSNTHLLGVPGKSILDFSQRANWSSAVNGNGLIRFAGTRGSMISLTADSVPWDRPFATSTSITNAAGVGTMTTAAAHGLVPGDWVILNGGASTDGQKAFVSSFGSVPILGQPFKVLTAPTATTLTYTLKAGADASWTGSTITIYPSGTVVGLNTTGIADDSMLFISSSAFRSDLVEEFCPIGEVAWVERVTSSEALTLRAPVRDSYLLSDSAFAQVITPVENIVVENLSFIGKGANTTGGIGTRGDQCLMIENFRNATVRNCQFRDIDLFNIYVGLGRNALIEHCDITFDPQDIAGATTGSADITYGIVFVGTEDLTIRDNFCQGGRHSIDQANDSSVVPGSNTGIARNVSIVNNHFGGCWQASIATHLGNEYLTIEGNTIDGGHSGISVRWGRGTVIRGNLIRGMSNVGIDVVQRLGETTVEGNVIEDVANGIVMAALGATEGNTSYLVGDLIIRGNLIKRTSSPIIMDLRHDPAVLGNLLIEGNDIRDAGSSGIFLRAGLTTNVNDSGVTAVITDNMIRNCGRATSSAAGINLTHARDCIISDNRVDISETALGRGIWLQGATWTRGNILAGNRVNGGTIQDIVLVGNGNVVDGVLHRLTTAGTAVANTTTETALATAITIPANFVRFGRVLKIKAAGNLSTDATVDPNLTIAVKWGAATIWSTGAVAQGTGNSNKPWQIEVEALVRTIGTTSNLEVSGYGQPAALVGAANTAVKSLDLTADTTLGVYATWGTADADNTIQLRQWIVELSG